MQTPEGKFYSKEHEWAEISGNMAVVGITYHAQDALGDVVYVELPKAGAELKQMKEFGVVESVKTVSTLFSPLSGKVVEINSELSSRPELVNQDPYGKGWLVKLELPDPSETKALMQAKEYDSFVASSK